MRLRAAHATKTLNMFQEQYLSIPTSLDVLFTFKRGLLTTNWPSRGTFALPVPDPPWDLVLPKTPTWLMPKLFFSQDPCCQKISRPHTPGACALDTRHRQAWQLVSSSSPFYQHINILVTFHQVFVWGHSQEAKPMMCEHNNCKGRAHQVILLWVQ